MGAPPESPLSFQGWCDLNHVQDEPAFLMPVSNVPKDAWHQRAHGPRCGGWPVLAAQGQVAGGPSPAALCGRGRGGRS